MQPQSKAWLEYRTSSQYTVAHLVRLKFAGHVSQSAHVAGGWALSCHPCHLSVCKTAFIAVFYTLPLGWVIM